MKVAEEVPTLFDAGHLDEHRTFDSMRCGLLTILLLLPASALAQAGALDPSFGDGGLVVTDFGEHEGGNAAALLPDGRILVVGGIGYGFVPVQQDVALVRYRSSGELDSTFGANGLVRLRLDVHSAADALAQLPDGRTLVGGTIGSSGDRDLFLLRVTPSGDVDTTFGQGGIVRTSFGNDEVARDMALLPDGRIVVAGISRSAGPRYDQVIARYLPDGALDSTFGNGGLVRTDLSDLDFVGAIAIQPDGSLLVTGSVYVPSFESDILLMRYLPDGTRDPTFGNDGVVIDDYAAREDGLDLALLSDGRILLVATSGFEEFQSIVLNRYMADGTLDSTFTNGRRPGINQTGSVVGMQADGRILVGGRRDGFFTLHRFLPNGMPDLEFGTSGYSRTSLVGAVRRLLAQPDGRAVLIGHSGSIDIGLGRFLLEGAVGAEDPPAAPNSEAPIRSMAVAPNPARGAATLTLALQAPAHARVAVYDVLGREVRVLHAGPLRAGATRLALDVGALPAGAYVARASIAGVAATSARFVVAR